MLEVVLFVDFDMYDYMMLIDGLYVVMLFGFDFDLMWSCELMFVISIDDMLCDFECKGVMLCFCDMFVVYVNCCCVVGWLMFLFDYDVVVMLDECVECIMYYFGWLIVLMMLYMLNIGSYVCVVEWNFWCYCDVYGYMFYVYCDIFVEIGLNVIGNWFKLWLLYVYL